MAASFLQKLRSLAPARGELKPDLVAGITFAVVAVPQAMGHALLATVNPVMGIFTLMVAVPVAALTTGSVFMNVSTTAALSVAAGAELAAFDPGDRIAALAALVLLVGVIQLVAGLLRAGSILRFVSDPVMTGFLNGVAVLIILGQLGELTGYRSAFPNAVARALDLLLRIHRVDVRTTVVGVLALAAIVLLLRSRLSKFAFVLAIAFATALLAVLSLPALDPGHAWQSVRIVRDVSSIPRSLPGLSLPQPGMLVTMLLPALSVAIIGLVQGAGVSQAYVNPDGRFPDVSRDFLGQGAANVATGLVGGLPAGGSISGTALILGAGARSRWTNVFGGVVVAVIVLLAAPLAEMVPMPALAALLIVAGYQGLRIEPALTAWRTGRVPAAAMTLTFLATLFLPLHFAVLLGVAFTVVLHVSRESKRTEVQEIVLVPGGMPELRPAPAQLRNDDVTVLVVNGTLFFAAAKSVGDMLPSVEGSSRSVVILALRGKTDLGSTFIAVLLRYARALHARGGLLLLAGVEPAARDQLARTGTLQVIGAENVFLATEQLGASVNLAAAAAREWLGRPPAAGSH
ncbi:MAG TPA: SulP family inorganic anion transporter [Anaeromyxobacteraceae bacterium]|nr:SulP family inorganic anion transporter [Anaeromyxobacteraceae bacterium]